MTKKAEHPRFIVRLNLNNERHREAWERLRQRGGISYTEAVVGALCRQTEREGMEMLRDELTHTVRSAVMEAAVQYRPALATAPPASEQSMTDADYDAAMDFMDNLG